MRKTFLFLQGPATDFFAHLAQALAARGHKAASISFCAGDALLWRGAGPRFAFRGRLARLEPFLRELAARLKVTDLVMLGDTRPVHAVAMQVAQDLGLTTHVWEEGYLRPFWLTLERGGINGHSRLPRDPAWYLRVAPKLPEVDSPAPLPNPIWRLAAWEVAYKLPGLLNPLLYPGYRTHRPMISPLEFLGWGLRFATLPRYERGDRRTRIAPRGSGRPFFLLALQLDGDSQIERHSPFRSVGEVIRTVMASFAAHAPGDVYLVIKNHPLDTGWGRHGRLVRRYADKLGVAGRTHFVETGHLPDFWPGCRGVVGVNSTVGAAALAAGLPVIALGEAVYGLPGLTFQGGLDAFWTEAAAPDATLFSAFRRVVLHGTQVAGSFYSRAGQRWAIAAAVPRMEAERSPLDALVCESPNRY